MKQLVERWFISTAIVAEKPPLEREQWDKMFVDMLATHATSDGLKITGKPVITYESSLYEFGATIDMSREQRQAKNLRIVIVGAECDLA